MPPSLVTYAEKLPAARSAGASRRDEGHRGQATGGQPAEVLGIHGVVSSGGGWGVSGTGPTRTRMPNSLRTLGRRTQDGVVLAEDPIILLSVVLMALVARGDGVLGHLRLERILVAEAEVGPVAGLVLEPLRVLDRGLQAGELALEVAIAAGRFL